MRNNKDTWSGWRMHWYRNFRVLQGSGRGEHTLSPQRPACFHPGVVSENCRVVLSLHELDVQIIHEACRHSTGIRSLVLCAGKERETLEA